MFEPTKVHDIFPRLKQNISPILFQPAITCSKLTIETLEQEVKYVQS